MSDELKKQTKKFALDVIALWQSTQIPVCLWFEVKRNALDAANDSRLFDGETELSLVA